MPFVHHLRPRYAEVDQQGVVFNAHWLTYFDEASTRFIESLGFSPAVAFVRDFDLMIVKAVVEWQGPAGFDDDVAVAVVPGRIGTKSFDLVYTATCNGSPCSTGTVTYVSVVPGTHDSTPIPEPLRGALDAVAPS
ncbi:MAG: acyl-CoA thioesterase [Acidimicrobiia bacterium]